MSLLENSYTAIKRINRLPGSPYVPGDNFDGSEFADEAQARHYIANGLVDVVTTPQESGAFVTKTEFDDQGPSGREIAYAESTVAQTGITTATDITGLVVTSFTVSTRPVVVEAFLPGIYGTTIGTGLQVFIADAANAVTAQAGFTCAVEYDVRPIIARERITTPGTYTRKVRAARNAGTGTVGNGFDLAAVTASISVTEK